MPARATGGDAVADELFDLLDFRKAAPLLARPDVRTSNTPPVLSGVSVTEPSLLGKRAQQLLRHPAGPNQVTTMPGLKNSSIGCNRPTSRRMLHRC
jgi:hypothetical protein